MPEIRTISEIADSVRARRIELAMSQDDLARRAGVSRKWIYEFEAGKHRAELGIVLAVLEALGLSLVLGPAQASEANGSTGAMDLDKLLDDYSHS